MNVKETIVQMALEITKEINRLKRQEIGKDPVNVKFQTSGKHALSEAMEVAYTGQNGLIELVMKISEIEARQKLLREMKALRCNAGLDRKE